MSMESVSFSRVVSDPLALRALAHPMRMKIAGLVGREGTITGSEVARQLGISQALASHHLHQLAKYGFVEPAPSEDNRARPWRVTSTSTRFKPEDQDAQQANELLQRLTVEQAGQELADWHAVRGDVDPEGRWTDLTDVMNGLLYLTVEELAEFRTALQAVISPLIERRRVGDHASRPADAEPVTFTVVTTPIPRTDHGG
jgi:DNA-binding MarR family transcriptional regulator